MANLAESSVVVRANYTGGGNNGKKYSYYELTVTLAAMGTDTNYIGAAALGLGVIKGCSEFIKSSDDIILVATPNYDGSKILLKAAGTNAPADFTGDFRFTVWGTLAN